jgi:branched-chain amino acid transport system ATP-binding protein
VTTPAIRKIKIKIENLSFSVGSVTPVDSVSLDIYDNEILAVIVPAGAGESYLLNCISGFSKPQSGDIYFEGRKITGIRADKAAQLGMARTFQNGEVFPGLTTLENLMSARHLLVEQNFFTGALYVGPAHGEELDHRRAVEDIINFLGLEAVRKSLVGTLSDYQRKKVEFGRALATEPSVLLLDELITDLKPQEKADLISIILDVFKGLGDIYPRTPVLRDGVKCLVLFTSDPDAVKSIADRVVVLGSVK